MRSGELRPDFGPAAPHPTGGRDAGHRAPAARRLQRRARHASTSRSPRRSPPSCASPAAGSAGVRAIADRPRRPRPDLDQRPRSGSRCRSAAVIERVRALAAPRGARPVAGEVVGLVPRSRPARPSRRRAAAGLRSRASRARAPARRLGLSRRRSPRATTRRGRGPCASRSRADLVDHRPHLGAGEVDRGAVLVRRAAGRVRGRADARRGRGRRGRPAARRCDRPRAARPGRCRSRTGSAPASRIALPGREARVGGEVDRAVGRVDRRRPRGAATGAPGVDRRRGGGVARGRASGRGRARPRPRSAPGSSSR